MECEGMVVAISAAGSLLNYLEETQKQTSTLKKLSVLKHGTHMLLDATTQKNLEITKSLKDGGMKAVFSMSSMRHLLQWAEGF
ncbi:MAG: hypothetical protein L0958_05330 [Candidatus Mariimomonas ferrooxydans]